MTETPKPTPLTVEDAALIAAAQAWLTKIRDWQGEEGRTQLYRTPDGFKGSPFDYLRKMADDGLRALSRPTNAGAVEPAGDHNVAPADSSKGEGKDFDYSRTRVFERRNPVEHELKTWAVPYQAVEDGSKGFEFRKHDRDYREGDTLWLRETEVGGEVYTGKSLRRVVTYCLLGGQFGVPLGYVVMSLAASPAPDQSARLRQYEAAIERAVEVIAECRAQFWSYYIQHMAKEPVALEKATTNAVFVKGCDAALAELRAAQVKP